MEGDAGTRQLNPTDAEDAPDDSVAVSEQENEPATELTEEVSNDTDGVQRRSPRLGRGWMAGICATLLILSAGAAVGGVLLMRDNDDSEAIARSDEAALQAARDCVAALQAPDTEAMSAAQMKIMECSTGAFGAQASTFGGILVEAYKAANVKVQVSDMRAAVERHDPNGSVDVLVAVRIKVTNSEVENQESGYRLRVTMTPDEGRYRIDKMEQVTS